MSLNVKQRTERIGARPDVVRWHRRLRKVLAEMPPELWIYAGSGTLYLMVKDEAGMHAMRGGRDDESVDQDAVLDTLPGSCDGGDW